MPIALFTTASLSADGRRLFYTRQPIAQFEGAIPVHAMDLTTGRSRGPWLACSFTISRDGATLFASDRQGVIRRIDVVSGKARVLHAADSFGEEDDSQGYGDLEVSDDGHWLSGAKSYVSGFRRLIVDANTGAELTFPD